MTEPVLKNWRQQHYDSLSALVTVHTDHAQLYNVHQTALKASVPCSRTRWHRGNYGNKGL